MGHHVGLTPRLLMVGAHCLAENIALVGLEYLLVPQCEKLVVSQRLNSLRVNSLVASLILNILERLNVVISTHAHQRDCIH